MLTLIGCIVLASSCISAPLHFESSNSSRLVKRDSFWPASISAPFCDILLWPTFDIVTAAQETGNKYFTLAFIQSDGNGNPAWGSIVPLNENYYSDKIQGLRMLGGDVIISFGGAIGKFGKISDSKNLR